MLSLLVCFRAPFLFFTATSSSSLLNTLLSGVLQTAFAGAEFSCAVGVAPVTVAASAQRSLSALRRPQTRLSLSAVAAFNAIMAVSGPTWIRAW